jgi:NTE family protein
MMAAKVKQKPLALALGGGGVRGVAHLGVLKALAEAGIVPTAIAGTSSGALVGMLWRIYGLDGRECQPHDILDGLGVQHYAHLHHLLDDPKGVALGERLRHLADWERSVRNGLFGNALAPSEPMRLALAKVIGGRRFADLHLPFACIATDLRSGEKIVLRKGSLLEAALATCAVAGVLPPVALGEWLLADGHIVDNLPAGVARELLGADEGVVLAVDVGYDPPHSDPKSAFDVVLRASAISREQLRRNELVHADLVVSVGAEVPSGSFEAARAEALCEAGYHAMHSQIALLRGLLGIKPTPVEPTPIAAKPTTPGFPNLEHLGKQTLAKMSEIAGRFRKNSDVQH